MAEPEWDEATRDLVLAYDLMPTCQVCGGPAALCQDPAREFDWVVDKPIRCHATTALINVRDNAEEAPSMPLSALNWSVHLRTLIGEEER